MGIPSKKFVVSWFLAVVILGLMNTSYVPLGFLEFPERISEKSLQCLKVIVSSTILIIPFFAFFVGMWLERRRMSLQNLAHACELSDLHARMPALEKVVCYDAENPMATREQKQVLHAWRSVLTDARASLEWHVERLFGKNSDRPEKYHDLLKGIIDAVRQAAENRLTEREKSTEHFQELVEPVEADKWRVTMCFGPPGSRWWRKIVICLEDISDTKGNLLIHGSSPVIPVFPFVTPAPAPVAAPVASAKEVPVVPTSGDCQYFPRRKCSHCGHENLPDATACSGCGIAVVPTAKEETA